MDACLPQSSAKAKARSAAWLKKQRAREAKAKEEKTRVSFFCDRLRWTLRQALELCLGKITRAHSLEQGPDATPLPENVNLKIRQRLLALDNI